MMTHLLKKIKLQTEKLSENKNLPLKDKNNNKFHNVKQKGKFSQQYVNSVTLESISKEQACSKKYGIDPRILRNPRLLSVLLTPYQIAVLDVLFSLGGCGIINPSQEKYIAIMVGCSRRTVVRAIKVIADLGLIATKYIHYRTSRYRISQLFTLSWVCKLLSNTFENIGISFRASVTFFNLGKKLIEGNVSPILILKEVTNKFDKIGPDGLTVVDIFNSLSSFRRTVDNLSTVA